MKLILIISYYMTFLLGATVVFKMAECEVFSPLPTVNQRLGHLKPSRELLEFYRKKIAEYDGEHEDMNRKLLQYKCTYEEQVGSKFCFGAAFTTQTLYFTVYFSLLR